MPCRTGQIWPAAAARAAIEPMVVQLDGAGSALVEPKLHHLGRGPQPEPLAQAPRVPPWTHLHGVQALGTGPVDDGAQQHLAHAEATVGGAHEERLDVEGAPACGLPRPRQRPDERGRQEAGMVVAGLGDPRRTPVRLARPGGRETVEEARFGSCAAVDGALQGQGCDDKGIVRPGLTDAGLGHERKSSTRTRAVRGIQASAGPCDPPHPGGSAPTPPTSRAGRNNARTVDPGRALETCGALGPAGPTAGCRDGGRSGPSGARP